MLEQGGVSGVTVHPVRTLGFIAIIKEDEVISEHGPDESAVTLDNLTSLISRYQTRSQGYNPMSAMEKADSFSEFDGISRYGEWDLADEPQPIEIGDRDE